MFRVTAKSPSGNVIMSPPFDSKELAESVARIWQGLGFNDIVEVVGDGWYHAPARNQNGKTTREEDIWM